MLTLFSKFPGGLPSVGLLLIRASSGGFLIFQGGVTLLGPNPAPGLLRAGGLIGVVCGVCLLLGYLTPLVSLLGAAAAMWLPMPALPQVDGRIGSVLVAVTSVAVSFLGPGTVSLDARLFGRREIRIPDGRGPSRKIEGGGG